MKNIWRLAALCLLVTACHSSAPEKREENHRPAAPIEAADNKSINTADSIKAILDDHDAAIKNVRSLDDAIYLTPSEDLHVVSGGQGDAYIVTKYGVYYVSTFLTFRIRETSRLNSPIPARKKGNSP